jgi:hypothetical protein
MCFSLNLSFLACPIVYANVLLTYHVHCSLFFSNLRCLLILHLQPSLPSGEVLEYFSTLTKGTLYSEVHWIFWTFSSSLQLYRDAYKQFYWKFVLEFWFAVSATATSSKRCTWYILHIK